jgi:hypothetical protein
VTGLELFVALGCVIFGVLQLVYPAEAARWNLETIRWQMRRMEGLLADERRAVWLSRSTGSILVVVGVSLFAFGLSGRH